MGTFLSLINVIYTLSIPSEGPVGEISFTSLSVINTLLIVKGAGASGYTIFYGEVENESGWMVLTQRSDDRAIQERLASWGLVPAPEAPDSPPLSKHQLLLCHDRAGRRVVVKLAPSAHDPGLAREADTLVLLARQPALQAGRLWTPTPLHFDRELSLMALPWFASGPTLHAYHRQKGAWGASVARPLGCALATLHGHGGQGVLRDWAVASGDRDVELLAMFIHMSPAFYAHLSPAGLAFFAAVQADGEAIRALHALATGPGERTLIHGDAKPANILRLPGSSDGPRGKRYLWLDWELSGLGHPARDVGTLMAHYVQCWLAPEGAEEGLHQAVMREFLVALLRSYRYGRLRVGRPAERDFVLGSVRWLGVALLHQVYGRTHFSARYDEPAMYLTRYALDFVKDPYRWAWELLEASP